MKLSTILAACLCFSGITLPLTAQQSRYFRISGPAPTRITSANTNGIVTWTNSQPGTSYTFQASRVLAGPTSWVDYVNVIGSPGIGSNQLFDPNPPLNMVLIPAGTFTMGDNLDADATALPLHSVAVAAFYMDWFDVTKSLWDTVYNWALTNGYSFDNGGEGAGPNYPVQMVNWFDCVKWINARSEMTGRKPAYYTDATLRLRYHAGQSAPYVDWNAGFRLPTEAEWEKAARGGLNGQRYPWGNAIDPTLANYNNPDETTTPVDSYPPNNYGLYDMSGNMWQWCWDWSGSYSDTSQVDPRGPSTGSRRVNRGGGMVASEYGCRVAARTSDLPTFRDNYVGFRCVLPSR